jgi:hypothetical protein
MRIEAFILTVGPPAVEGVTAATSIPSLDRTPLRGGLLQGAVAGFGYLFHRIERVAASICHGLNAQASSRP